MKLIVGLGNPGPRYADTRHNVGWRVVEEVAGRMGAKGAWKEKFDAAVLEVPWHGERVVLARPLTFMNESGRAVRQWMDFFKMPSEDLLVVLDDLAIDVGRVRLRPGGSDGGHQGLRSVIAHVGHEAFARLRVGIGPAPAAEDQVNFVLEPFRKDEQPVIDACIGQAAEAALYWMTEGLEEAMNQFNRPKEEA